MQLKLAEVISTRSHVCSASAKTVPDLFVVLPNTLAASPNAASDGPVRETRAAAPASRPSAARLLTACVHPNAAQKRQNTLSSDDRLLELWLCCCATHRILLLGLDYYGDTNSLCCRRALQLYALAHKGSFGAKGLHCHSHDNSRDFDRRVCREAISLRLSDVLLLYLILRRSCQSNPHKILPNKFLIE